MRDEDDTREYKEAVSHNSEGGKSKWAKISLTVVIVTSYICLACYRSIAGPTIMNMAYMVNATTTSIPIIFTMRSIGYVVGFIIGGLFLDRVRVSYYRQFLIIVVNVVMALTAIAIPFCKNLVHLGATFLAAGVSLSILDLSLNIFMLQMWQGESPRYYQTLHFSYAVGYLIGPIIGRIFLDDIEGGTDYPNKIEMMDLHSLPRLIYGYVILCIMLLCVAAMWIGICMAHIGLLKSAKSKSSLLKEPNTRFKVYAIATTSFLMFLDGCIELGYQHMLSTFAFTNYGVSSVHSADITTMFWGCFAIGSLITIILAGFFHPHCLVITNNVIELLAGVILIFLVERSNKYLALGNCILGLGASTLFANTILWFGSYVTITHRTMGIFLLSESLAEMVIPEILGAVLESSHRSLSYFVTVIPIIYLAIFFSQCILFYPTGEKYPTHFNKPGQKIIRRRFCPIFLFKKIKTEEEKEDAEAPPDDESNEGISVVPVHDTRDSQEDNEQKSQKDDRKTGGIFGKNDKKSKEKAGKKSKEKDKKSNTKASAAAKSPEDESEDGEDDEESKVESGDEEESSDEESEPSSQKSKRRNSA